MTTYFKQKWFCGLIQTFMSSQRAKHVTGGVAVKHEETRELYGARPIAS